MQFAQDVVGDVPGGASLTVEEDRDVVVAEADFFNEGAQLDDRCLCLLRGGELLVVDGQEKAEAQDCCWAKEATSPKLVTPRASIPSSSIALASTRTPVPLAFSERKSSSTMTTGKRKRMGGPSRRATGKTPQYRANGGGGALPCEVGQDGGRPGVAGGTLTGTAGIRP